MPPEAVLQMEVPRGAVTRRLWPSVEPARSIVIEDAIVGVEAGHTGKFGLVVGVARKGNAEELRQHGAQVVVSDLGELVY
jgi:beta-phosphoglucomutase-like phosphatase (HAD superfamily)